MLALDMVWQEHKTPQDDSYVPKDGLVIAWSFQVVKALIQDPACGESWDRRACRR